jgi:hypothetical protein
MQRRFFASESSASLVTVLSSELALSQSESSLFYLPRPSLRPSVAPGELQTAPTQPIVTVFKINEFNVPGPLHCFFISSHSVSHQQTVTLNQPSDVGIRAQKAFDRVTHSIFEGCSMRLIRVLASLGFAL